MEFAQAVSDSAFTVAGSESVEGGRTAPASAAQLVMFRDCPFCGVTHRSPYVDELEEMVLRCRANAPPEKQGNLEMWWWN
jgi:hypothetical protein